MSQYVLELKGIKKSFGAVSVLKGVDFSLTKGEVHALVGGNGAGKSTLMKIMTGVYTRDDGEIYIDDRQVMIHSTHDAKDNGIAMIFQELSLVQTMTVAENIFLGEEVTRHGIRDTAYMNKKAKEVLDELGIAADPDVPVNKLSVGMSQMIEIAKAVSKQARILVLDEPTAALSDSETAELFKMIGDLKEKGVSMVYISHRMNEIMQIADSITILRDGVNVDNDAVCNLTLDDIIAHMIGGAGVNKKFDWIERKYDKKGADILTVQHLNINSKLQDISFSLKKGEILGFAGLMGSGRTEILETLFGVRKKESGTVLLNGKVIEVKSTRDAVKAGFALIPEDRRKQGLVLIHSVKENAILPIVTKLRKKKILVDEKAADEMVAKNIEQLNIITDGIQKRINLLSGGNQQKVVIAKWLNMNPQIMMLDEPTAGVDIGAKTEIIELIRNFADEGKGVIFVSSELTELMAVCDRIIILYDGRITGEIERKEIKAEEELQYAIQKGE
ncbi:sugar ABC transporter ATP-binding protein [Robinsoniella sp. KNHs210]|uniref:sugar ABC transporter ATP-binding protein n=1 Tax=Robinsoniella sp. KNHs210 TaxID=1469950 RepID=UPI000482F5C1|nr:sugar ABC transporter ATP-binding protein [Robinsoniella sp. KNHs210]